MGVAEQALVNPADWALLGEAQDWRSRIGIRTRKLWDTFSDDLKIALAEDADDMLLAGAD